MYVLLLLAFLSCATPWQAGTNQNPSGQTDGKPASQIQSTPDVSPGPQASTSPPAKGNEARKNATPGPESKSWLTHGEWVSSILTFAYVVISLFAFFAIKRQAVLTEEQAESARKEFTEQLAEAEKTAEAAKASADAAKISADGLINSERAWLVMTAELPEQLTPAPANTVTRVRWTIKNVGRSPARIIETDAIVWRVETLKGMRELPRPPRFVGTPLQMHKVLLVPGDSIHTTWMLESNNGPDGLTFDDVERIKNLKLTLLTYGFAKYLIFLTGSTSLAFARLTFTATLQFKALNCTFMRRPIITSAPNDETRLSSGFVFVIECGLFAAKRWPAFERFVVVSFPVGKIRSNPKEGIRSNPR